MVNNLKKWQDEPDINLKESGVWHLPTADRGLQTNPESPLLKANRSKVDPEA